MKAKQLLHHEPIRVVSFDLWGTIVAPNPAFNERRIDFYYEHLGASKQSLSREAFRQAFFATKDRTERRSEQTGQHISYEVRMRELCQDLGLPKPDAVTLQEWQHQQHALLRDDPALLIDAGIPQLFQDIVASGRDIAIVSNSGLVTAEDARHLLDIYTLKVYTKYLLFSDELQITKPNPLLFAKLIKIAQCSPANILHIGDSEVTDYEGAVRAGLSALLTPLTAEGIRAVRAVLTS